MNKKNWEKPEPRHNKLTKWNWMVQYPENLEIGDGVDIGAFTYINAKYGVKIGKGVQIGSHCSIYSENTIDEKKGGVVIEEGAKIGTHSSIMPNVKIGKGAKVGAYSFVKQDVPANTLVYGRPAKKRIE